MVDVGSQDQQTLISVGQNIVRALNNLVSVTYNPTNTSGIKPTSFSDRLRGVQIDGSIQEDAPPAPILRPGTPDGAVPAMIDPNLIITTQEPGAFAGYLELVLPDGARIRVPFYRTS